jgi:hypothetical protein
MERKLGAWLIYLGTMTPSFLLVNSVSYGQAFCMVSFIIFMLIQTAIYIQIMRMEEDEQYIMRWNSECSEPPTDNWGS